MMSLPVSVVIVSRHRPESLKRCLLAVSQLQYAPFEVVVVADPAGVEAVQTLPFADVLKLIPFDAPNISQARNLGIAQAAGEVVAFIDDDAVPEPQWLRYLIAPSDVPSVAAMGGFVRARNGISFQWKARSLDAFGHATALTVTSDEATVLHPPADRAVKTEGTNMAVRRSVLVELGGFDPAFHYYLDETDLNMRLARAGHATAIAPLAEVHHGFEANAMRDAARVPKDLFDIGASWAVFQRKHIPQSAHADHWQSLRMAERLRLLRHLQIGMMEPRQVRRLLHRLDAGYLEGQARPFGEGELPSHAAAPFNTFPSRPRTSVWIESRPTRLRADLALAAQRVQKGEIVSLCSLSTTALYHRVRFTADGVWLQKGGIYGRSERKASLFRMLSRSRRHKEEHQRVAKQRGLCNEKVP